MSGQLRPIPPGTGASSPSASTAWPASMRHRATVEQSPSKGVSPNDLRQRRTASSLPIRKFYRGSSATICDGVGTRCGRGDGCGRPGTSLRRAGAACG
jgi:hypothetical protein